MPLLVGIRPTTLLALAGLALAGAGTLYYGARALLAVPGGPPASVLVPLADSLGPGEALVPFGPRTFQKQGVSRGAEHSGRLLDIRASFDELEGGQLQWAWRQGSCGVTKVSRQQVSEQVPGGKVLVREWTLCVAAIAGEPTLNTQLWHPTEARSSSSPEGVVLVLATGGTRDNPEYVFAAAAGLCPGEGSCLASLQVGATSFPSRLSMSLAAAKGEVQYFVLDPSALRPSRNLMSVGYEEVEVGTPAADDEGEVFFEDAALPEEIS